MDTVATMTVALAAIGLGALAFVQLNRRENIADDFSDTDCRTTALAEELAAGGEIVAGGGGAEIAARRTCLVALHDKGRF